MGNNGRFVQSDDYCQITFYHFQFKQINIYVFYMLLMYVFHRDSMFNYLTKNDHTTFDLTEIGRKKQHCISTA